MAHFSNKGAVSASDLELQKMVRGFRVTDLHSLLTFAGRNKGGKKYDLQNRALDLIKLHSPSIEMKIREIHLNRQPPSQRHSDPKESVSCGNMYPVEVQNMNEASARGGPYGAPLAHHGAVGTGVPGYVSSINKQVFQNVHPLNMIPSYAVHPDIKFRDLPFFDVLHEVLKPTSLVPHSNVPIHEREFMFYLTPQQVFDLEQNLDVSVQVRFCLLDTNCEQNDEFPTSVVLKINEEQAELPALLVPKPGTSTESKRIRCPVDISNITKFSTVEGNRMYVSWSSPTGRPFVVAVFIVRKITGDILIRRLKANGVRNPDHTTAVIKEKLCQDPSSEIATMSLRGSLICPLGTVKMQLPCRALTCTHLQCFDATLYVQMNEKKSKWICPVCDKPAYFKDLAIDGLFLDIVSKAPSECTEVQFHEDGSWTPVMPVKKTGIITDTVASKKQIAPKPKKPAVVEVISLDSDSDTEDSWSLLPLKKQCNVPVGIITPVNLDSEETVAAAAQKLSVDPVPSVSNAGTLDSISAKPGENDHVTHDAHLESNNRSVPLPTTSSDPSLSCDQLSKHLFDQSSTASAFSDTDILDSVPNFNLYALIDNAQETTILPSYFEDNSFDVIDID